MKKYKKFNNDNLTVNNLIKRTFIFIIPTVLLCILFTMLFSAVFFNMPDSTSKISLCATLSLYFTAFFAGFIISKINGQKYLLGGALLGFLIFAINIIFFLIFEDNIELSYIMTKLLIPVTCILGSILGIKREKKPTKRKRY